VDELFWRAVALHPRVAMERDDLLRFSCSGSGRILLARYDRVLAGVLLGLIDGYLHFTARL
jgi:hypothetical protein